MKKFLNCFMEVIALNIKIATRGSKLALVQTDFIMSLLNQKFGAQCEKLLIKTEGDKRLDVSLDKIGGKGLFVKDIEKALLEGKADGAVHSMKDVPFEMDESFCLAAMPIREDVRDAFISLKGVNFYELPKGAKVGTSSNRRIVQIKNLRPDIITVPIRGNVETRIKKIETENLDGIVLAAAGLKRLGLTKIITNYFSVEDIVPAVGQGAIGVQVVKTNEKAKYFKALNNEDVKICVEAERSFMRSLNGDCHSAIGAYAKLDGEIINITGFFIVDGSFIKKSVSGNKKDYKMLGEALGEKILLG